MPELPEVEVARRLIEPEIVDRTITDAICRTERLRWPLDPQLAKKIRDRRLVAVRRRGKYLLLECVTQRETGWLIIHLGMSGSVRIAPARTPAAKHDHFDLTLGDRLLRLHDPRRFGAVIWHPGPAPEAHPLLASLGPEPFDPRIDGRWLYEQLARRHGPIKPALMDSHLIVGIGNIYASESLFRAGISPLRAAHRISAVRCERLLTEARATLHESIQAGGSSLRDYVHADGGLGCFQTRCAVYERAGESCPRCGGTIRQIRQTGRSTYFCPGCQT